VLLTHAGSSRLYVAYKSHVGHQLTDTWSNTGVWLTVTFTVERYISVCFPMKAMVWCTPRRARHIVIAVCVSAAVLTLPEFFATTAAQVCVRVGLDRHYQPVNQSEMLEFNFRVPPPRPPESIRRTTAEFCRCSVSPSHFQCRWRE